MSTRIRTCGRRGLVHWSLLVALLLPMFAVRTVAQQADASIVGQIKDATGQVLPGVTITATSPALQLPQMTTVSDAQGQYRLTPLPLGTYRVEYALQGFDTIRQEGVRLTAGFVARLDKVMTVSGVSETLTVSGAAPVVDATATVTSINLTRERLETIPNSNFGYVSLVNQAPGVRGNLDVGGSALETTGGGFLSASVFGQLGETWQLLEGVATNSPKQYTQSGSYMDYFSIDEARIDTVGANAETRTAGVTIMTIIKSGGNEFHGNGLFSGTGERFQSSNLNEQLAALGVTSGNKVKSRAQANVDLGGPIIRDKLWFYQDMSFRKDEFQFLDVFRPDGSPATNNKHQTFYTTKISYQLNRKNKLVAFQQLGKTGGPGNIVAALNRFNGWDTRAGQDFTNHTTKLEWQAVPTSNLTTSLQFGYFDWDSYKICPDRGPSRTDIATQVNSGCDWSRDGDHALEPNYHTRGTLTWFRPDTLAGNHQFTVGFDYLASSVKSYRLDRGEALNYQLVFNNGTPFEVNFNNFPLSASTNTDYLGVYGQDKWTIGRRVTIDWGLRYSHDSGYVPAQCHPSGEFSPEMCYDRVQFPIWNTVAPRLQVAWDVTGSGRTVLKGGWGRFDHARQVDPELTAANQNLATSTTFLWHDLNGNKLYEPGEVNRDPNGPDFVGTSALGTSTGTSFSIPNPNEKEPKQDQYQVSLEREVLPNLSVRVLGVYARLVNNYFLQNNFRPFDVYDIPVTRPIPEPDGTVAPGAKTITFYEYPSSFQGLQYQQTMLINDASLNKNYKSLEVAATRRLSGGFQFAASYTATKVHEPIRTGSALPAADPNSLINASDDTWQWLGRVSGSYLFPYRVTLSANFENRSGNTFARQALFTNPGAPIPSIVLNVEPIGSQRLPSTRLLDFRIDKAFSLGGGRQVSVRLNVYNMLNINTATGVNMRSGRTYLQPTTIVQPRILEFGASYRF